MRRLFQDLKEYSNGSILKSIYNLFFSANFHAGLNYRLAHFL